MVDTNCQNMPTSSNREHVIKPDVMAKAKELAALLSESEEVRFFQRAEEQIKNNTRVQELMAQLKKKQKEIVAFESFNNPAMVKKIEGEMEALQDELDSMPIVADFQQSQSDINYLLQLVTSVIRDTVAEKLNVEGAERQSEPVDCME